MVFHEAALPSVNRLVKEPLTCHEINTDTAIEALDTRVVTASSAAVKGIPESSRYRDSADRTNLVVRHL